MKILHVNTISTTGGATIAAQRLHKAMLAQGVESILGVQEKAWGTPNCLRITGKFYNFFGKIFSEKAAKTMEQLFWKKPITGAYTSFSLLPSFQFRYINTYPKNVTHLHWVTGGFLSPFDIGRLHGPVAWTLHDTWPFTGGCHFTNTGCIHYEKRCGTCPELSSQREYDLSRLHWQVKRNAVQRIKPVIIAPSKLIQDKAMNSGLLHDCRITYIPNGVDTSIFRPIPQKQARELLGLPLDKRIILFGAIGATSDYNKGFDLLGGALQYLIEKSPNYAVALFGASQSNLPLKIPQYALGQLHDELMLALAYSAADVFVCPSRQEAFSNTVLEALACGTPVVAFPVGGIPDMVTHMHNGWLATPYKPEELAKGITTILETEELRIQMGKKARSVVKDMFEIRSIAQQHVALYQEMLSA